MAFSLEVPCIVYPIDFVLYERPSVVYLPVILFICILLRFLIAYASRIQ